MLDARIPLQAQGLNLEPRANALARGMQLQGQQQNNAMRMMQMQQIQAAAQQQMAEREAAAKRQQQMDGYLASLSGRMGPPQPVNPIEAMQVTGDPKMVEFLMNAGNMGRQKVARTIEIAGPDGRPMTIQVDEFGSPVGQQMPKPVARQMVNTGGAVMPVNPYTQSDPLKMTFKPGDEERLAISRQQAQAATRQAGAAEDANSIARDLKNQKTREEIAALEQKRKVGEDQKASSVATMEDTLRVIDKALKHPGRKTATGMSGQVDPRNYVAGTDAMNFKIVSDQLAGKAFLQAFESLKGGGQITETEGKKATDAIARLNRAQSDSEYEVALKDLQGVVKDAYKRATGKEYASPDASTGVPSDIADIMKRYGK